MKKKKLIIIFLVFGAIGFVVGNTVGRKMKKERDHVLKIQSILEDQCDCESIEKSMYAKGIQYSRTEGYTTEKVDFTLTNCNYDNINKEGEQIVKQLNAVGLETFNLITLDFISEEKQETIIIKNGKIL